MRVNCEPHDGYGFERAFYGLASIDVDSRLRCHRVSSLHDGIRRVMGCQYLLDWNPKRPKTELARCLFRRVASRLCHGGKDLRLFSAIGTIVDAMGVDGFFLFNDRIVTIDLTVSRGKDSPRAHLILTRENFVRDQHYRIGDWIARALS